MTINNSSVIGNNTPVDSLAAALSTIKQQLAAIESLLPAIAAACGVHAVAGPQPSAPIFTLPSELALSQQQLAVLRSIAAAGFLSAAPVGTLQIASPQRRSAKTQLAYMCGRLWCGDRVTTDPVTHEPIWRRGPMMFPDKPLAAFFHTESLRNLRANRLDAPLPLSCRYIEAFFERAGI